MGCNYFACALVHETWHSACSVCNSCGTRAGQVPKGSASAVAVATSGKPIHACMRVCAMLALGNPDVHARGMRRAWPRRCHALATALQVQRRMPGRVPPPSSQALTPGMRSKHAP
eukprot:365457-Chlamydomonas_euryale.AAC.7